MELPRKTPGQIFYYIKTGSKPVRLQATKMIIAKPLDLLQYIYMEESQFPLISLNSFGSMNRLRKTVNIESNLTHCSINAFRLSNRLRRKVNS